MEVSLCNFSAFYIDVDISNEDDMDQWRFICIYDQQEEHNRHQTWDLIRHLGRDNSMSWLLTCDFNEILFSFEKKGRLHSKRQM